MNIKKEYIAKTRKYLEFVDSRYRSIGELEKEIEIIRHSDSAYLDYYYDEIGIKSKGPTKTIDDMVIRKEDIIFNKEEEIEHIKRVYALVKEMVSNLESGEADVIEYRYFKKDKSNSQYKIEEIANELHCSETTVNRKELKAIKIIAVKRYGDDAIIKEWEESGVKVG